MALDADWQGTTQTCKKLVLVSNDLQGHSRCESSSSLFYVSVFVMQPKGKKKTFGVEYRLFLRCIVQGG